MGFRVLTPGEGSLAWNRRPGAVVEALAQPEVPKTLGLHGDSFSHGFCFFSTSLWGSRPQRMLVRGPGEGTAPTPAES